MAPSFDLSAISGDLDAVLAQSPSPMPSNLAPLLLSSPNNRTTKRAEYEATISADAQALADMDAIQARLDALRNSIRAKHGRLQFLLSPLSSLPNELIIRIFTLVADHRTTDSLLPVDWVASIRISHVCSKWRQVSLDMPLLWTCLSVASSRQQKLFDVFVKRMGNLRMRLEVISSNRRVDGEKVPSFAFSPSSEDMGKISALRLVDDHMLQCLRLKTSRRIPYSLTNFEFSNTGASIDRYLENAERLSFVWGHMWNRERPLHFRFLRHLQFYHVDCDEVGFFWAVSTEMPLLETLVLQWVGDADHELWQVPEGRTHWEIGHPFPKLESLTLDNCCFGVWESLRIPEMPSLRSLSVTPHWSWTSEAVSNELRHLLSNLDRPLESLHYKFYYGNMDGMAEIVTNDDEYRSYWSRLKHLSIEHHREPSGGATPDLTLEDRDFLDRILGLWVLLTPYQQLHLRVAEELIGRPESWYLSRVEVFEVIRAERNEYNESHIDLDQSSVA